MKVPFKNGNCEVAISKSRNAHFYVIAMAEIGNCAVAILKGEL